MKKQLTLDHSNTIADIDGHVYHLPRVYNTEDLDHREVQNQDHEEDCPPHSAGGEETAPTEYFPPAEVGHTNNYTILKFYQMSRQFVQSVLRAAAHDALMVPPSPYSQP